MQSFVLPAETMRARRGIKWHRYPEHVLPAWVADMDFAVAEPVQQALVRLVEAQDYGYPWRAGDEALASAFAYRMRDRFGWEIDPDLVLPVADLVQALFASALAFSEPGDGIITQTPIYPPFLMAIDRTGRRRVENPLRDTGSRFELDVAGLRAAVDDTTRILFLCNPHNPTGRVFSEAELRALADLALERDLLIVSDEIHCDLVYSGHRHIPIATLSPEVAARTITLNSATKSFNIAGLRCAVMYFGSAELKERFHRTIPERLLGAVCSPGIDATIAAWRHAQPWLDSVMLLLGENRDRVAGFVRAELPGVRHYPPEATYLAWLDFRDVRLPAPTPFDFFLEHARCGFNPGADFGPPGATCVRVNFATSPEILEQILERMAGAVRACR